MAETATVRVAEGQLRGRRVASRSGGFYWSFQGVPYARPPLGPLRFKDAQPVLPWEGVRDALKEGDRCTQLDGLTKEVLGSEDCLYLNVYAPRPPGAETRPLPVMLFFHFGGFAFGSGDAETFGPDHLVADGVLLVTINYRLGPLGFLYLEDAAPGNAGLKDQVAALRWVQRNIAAFGGDPGNVTIFGVSAGGTSVHLHMLSPLSKGLFHRAIAMSGAALNPWAIQTEPAETTRRLARCLGCTSDDPAEIVEFLRGIDHKELLRVAIGDAVPDQDKERLMAFSFVPTPEKAVPGVETFLPSTAERLMKEGTPNAVPFMTGIAQIEGLVGLAFVDVRQEDTAKKVDAQWRGNVLPETRLPLDGARSAEALEEVRRFFLGGEPLSRDNLKGYLDMYSDITFNEGVMYGLKCLSKKAKTPVYNYLFTVDDKLNFMKNLMKIREPGACHADEVGYLFRQPFNDPDLPEEDSAVQARRRLIRLWTNFAKTGNPTPEDDSLLGVRWKPYTDEDRSFLEIGPQLRNDTRLYEDRMAFWEKLYSTYGTRSL